MVKGGSHSEYGVIKRLVEDGWFVVRSAGSGTADRPQVDIVAIRDEDVLLLESKNVGSYTLNVYSSSRQMRKIYNTTGIEPYFVLDFPNEMGIRYAPFTEIKIKEPENYNYFYKLLRKYE